MSLINHYGMPHKSGMDRIINIPNNLETLISFATFGKNGEIFFWKKNENTKINNEHHYVSSNLGVILKNGINSFILTNNKKYMFIANKSGY